jgi:hypothetical protein
MQPTLSSHCRAAAQFNRPIEPREFSVTGRVKEQIRAGRQIGQGKQIYPVAARQIGAVLHHEVAAQNARQTQQRTSDYYSFPVP